MASIQPTVGRVVLFHPGPFFQGAKASPGEPLPAMVARVWSDEMINVGGFDANGVPFSATSVKLLKDGEAPPEGQHYAEWMPYQKGQAAKTEALQQAAGGGA